MSVSKLATWLGTKSYEAAKYPKEGICLHHSAGTAENLKGIFDSRKVSTQYSAGPNHIYAYVDEDYVSWATGTTNGNRNWTNIEVINSGGAPNWPVADETYDNLIPLLADIARRHGFYPLIKYQNITEHKRFVATYCAGRVGERLDWIIERANALIAAGGDIAPAPARPAAPVPRPIVRLGSTGPLVIAVQAAVGVTQDGIFGIKTQAAVAALQKAHGLVADGIVGPLTWEVIDKAPVASAPAVVPEVTRRIISQGSTGEDVRAIQTALGITADGIFGKQTRAAVIAYQKAHGLVADGIVGVRTYAALHL